MSEERFIAEVGKVLTGRALAIYDRKTDLPEWKREAYIRILKGERPAPPPQERSVAAASDDCPHLEPGAKKKAGCRSCKKADPRKVDAFRCSKYDCLTTLDEPAVDVPRCCKLCPDNPENINRAGKAAATVSKFRSSAQPVRCDWCADTGLGTVHLLYHLLPVAENDIWLRNLSELATRSKLFTGRKVFAVMTGTDRFSRNTRKTNKAKFTLVDPDLVRRNLPPDAEVILVPNDPVLREVASWRPLWNTLLDNGCSDSDKVFYAHAKGVTRDDPTTRLWTERMYSVNLDHPRLVESALNRCKTAGAFKKIGRCFDARSEWHYSGSFFWSTVGAMREALARTEIAPKWWGNEAWPGSAFKSKEGGTLFGVGTNDTMDLYKPETWSRIELEYAAWLESH